MMARLDNRGHTVLDQVITVTGISTKKVSASHGIMVVNKLTPPQNHIFGYT